MTFHTSGSLVGYFPKSTNFENLKYLHSICIYYSKFRGGISTSQPVLFYDTLIERQDDFAHN